MSLLLRILFYCALAGTVTLAIYCGMVLVGAFRFAKGSGGRSGLRWIICRR